MTMESFRKAIKRLRPRMAALLNFMIPGMGYLFNRRRMLLGVTLCAFVLTLVIGTSAILAYPSMGQQAEDAICGIVLGAYIFLAIAFARDAYLDAKKIETQQTGKTEKIR